jgi:hypothetical protein
MMVSFLCKVAGDTDWHPVTSPSYDDASGVMHWLHGFMMGPNPVTIKDMRMW